MNLEQKINYQLNKFPNVKKVIKRIYQRGMYAVSKKIKSEGNIVRISPNDTEHEYFFGYYDKSPWDITDRYILCLKANDTWSDVSPKEKADILLIDTEKSESDPERVKKIAETSAWNVQQSCMLQWLGPDFKDRILFNDCRNGKYVSVILSLKTMTEKVIPAPVYTVSSDGKFALTLDFSRLYNLRPGYGYYNVPEKTKDVSLPDTTAIWKVSLETGEITELLKYTDFATFQPRHEMQENGTVHKVNHLMLSPNNQRFMVLYRWFNGERKYTRLITCNVDGADMYVLSDDDMVSHCFWKNDDEIIAFENKKHGGTGYYLMRDKTEKYYHCWKELTGDGHPSFSPDGKLVVTDSYPDRTRIQYIRVMDGDVRKNEVNIVAKVFAPFKYDNDTRCDLHPRWNHAGNKICFDSVFEGHRGLYVIDINKKHLYNDEVRMSRLMADYQVPKYSIITPMYNSFGKMNDYFKSLENQTEHNFEVIIIDDCSTNDSYKKVCQYVNNSRLNIRVLRVEKNVGSGNARNLGIKYARGDWILFIDSDDYVDNKLFEYLNLKCNEKNDIVLFDFNRIKCGKTVQHKTLMYQHGEKVNKAYAALWITTNVCGKVYKKSFVKNNAIFFPPIARFEDWVFVEKAIFFADSITYMEIPLYFYVDNEVSIVHTQNNGVYRYSKKALDILDVYLDGYPKEIKEALYIRELLYVAAKEQLENYNPKTLKKILDYVEKKYPNWKMNEYIKMFSKSQKILLKILSSKHYYFFKVIGKLVK